MLKNMVETEGPQMMSQYGTHALHVGIARLHARMCIHTPMHPGTHMHACARRKISNTYSFSMATDHERVSVLRYMYIARFV
jgi:hypothetical protein